MGIGFVLDMIFVGVLILGIVDVLIGVVMKDYNYGWGLVKVGGNYMFNDESFVIVDVIMILRVVYDEQVFVSFVIDG